jgi:tetratricopeptide (TPR) repeat protein
MSRLTCASLFVLGIAAGEGVGQVKSPWIGQTVFTRPDTPLRVADRIVDPGNRYRAYTVERANGAWLWLQSKAASGWAPAEQVVRAEDAITEATRDIEQFPNLAGGYQLRGLLRSDLADWDRALADFDRALEIRPFNASLHLHRSRVRLAKKDLNGAISDLNEAIALDSGPSEFWCARGMLWTRVQEYEKAIADLNEALKRDQGNVSALVARARAEECTGAVDRALGDYDEALKRAPENASAYESRALLWEHKGEHRRAIADYDQALRLKPENARAYHWRGDAWSALKEYDRAIEDYDRSLAIAPADAWVYHSRGRTFERSRLYAKALADYERASELDPNYLLAYVSQADLLSRCPDPKIRDTTRALRVATRACEVSAWHDYSALSALAAVHAAVGDFDKAVQVMSKAIPLTADEETKASERRIIQLWSERNKTKARQRKQGP